MSIRTPTLKTRPTVYVFRPGFDDMQRYPNVAGTEVQVCAGPGVGFMKNGTFHYICDAATHEFIGLVYKSSLVTRKQDRDNKMQELLKKN